MGRAKPPERAGAVLALVGSGSLGRIALVESVPARPLPRSRAFQVRRRQMVGQFARLSPFAAMAAVVRQEGVAALFSGSGVNTLKVALVVKS